MDNLIDSSGCGNASSTGGWLSARVNELLADRYGNLPVWVRAPKRGVEFYTGFSRAKLYEGAVNRHFRSASIREPGQTKGTRLFHLGSVLAYIEKCETAAGGAGKQA
jgi:hypothetical protein